MITISTSQLLSTLNIDERLKDESFIESICDDRFEDKKSGIVYLIRCGYYKLEFCFSKDHLFIYFMSELYERKHSQNSFLIFVDDLTYIIHSGFILSTLNAAKRHSSSPTHDCYRNIA